MLLGVRRRQRSKHSRKPHDPTRLGPFLPSARSVRSSVRGPVKRLGMVPAPAPDAAGVGSAVAPMVRPLGPLECSARWTWLVGLSLAIQAPIRRRIIQSRV